MVIQKSYSSADGAFIWLAGIGDIHQYEQVGGIIFYIRCDRLLHEQGGGYTWVKLAVARGARAVGQKVKANVIHKYIIMALVSDVDRLTFLSVRLDVFHSTLL